MEKSEKKLVSSSAVVVEKIAYYDGKVYFVVRDPRTAAIVGVYTSVEDLSTFLTEL